MHKPEPILENETNEILWYFEIQMDHTILVRRPNLEWINKQIRTCYREHKISLLEFNLIDIYE